MKPRKKPVKTPGRLVLALLLACLLTGGLSCNAKEGGDQMQTDHVVTLPPATTSGTVSLEETLEQRRSVRSYSDQPLKLDEISQMLWAAQGITDLGRGLRSSPSAGATYPLEILVAAGNVSGLPAGLYRYRPRDHVLEAMGQEDLRPALHRTALNQSAVLQAPAVFIITAVPRRTETRYGQRAERYVFMEAGHAGQNLCLQGVALGIGTVLIGAFHDADTAAVLDLARDERPLYLIPAGRP